MCFPFDPVFISMSVVTFIIAAYYQILDPSLYLPSTHCYQSVRTNVAAEPYVNCFSVWPIGTFARVFQAGQDTDYAKNAKPGFVMPGLWDGHGHMLQYGEFLNSVDLFGSSSMSDVQSRILAYVDENPKAGSKVEWLRGIGWDQMALGKMPTAVS